ncbi:MAG: tetratricopeptide repeat protein [Gemmatimonadota bacterium]
MSRRLRRNDFAGAIPLFRRAADIYERAVNPDFWLPNAIRINLAHCLTETQQYAEAERILLVSHERLGRALGTNSDQAKRARGARRLVRSVGATGSRCGVPLERRRRQLINRPGKR